MKYVKLFEGFKKKDIHAICKKWNIRNYTINPDGSIDVDYDVYINKYDSEELPIRFNRVDGAFECSESELTTLEGAPTYVGNAFYCHDNKLTTLKGAPNYVYGTFECESNNIMTFEGAPNYIFRGFYCVDNPIEVIWALFRDYSKVELLNDYDALRIEDGKGICILSRLNGFLEDIGKPKLTDKQKGEIKKYYKIR